MPPVECYINDIVARKMPDIFKTTDTSLDNVKFTIYSLRKHYEIYDLRQKPGFLMISVKNKSFSNQLIESYFDFAESHLTKSFITIVDTPYFHNIIARNYDEETKQAEIKKLERISDENHRRVTRLLKKREPHNIKLISWTELERQTPQWLHEEVSLAFNYRGQFYQDIVNRTSEVIPQEAIEETQLEAYSQFLLEEIPILCNQYYLQKNNIVDVYPGENPDLFWRIEAGYYSDELPRLSKAAMQGSGLIYVDFRLDK